MNENKHIFFILGILSFSSVIFYILVSLFSFGIGFPLDDAWIHQTYSRNLALRGEWSFISGQPSAGSTGPLWAGLLMFGHILPISPQIWTFILGWLSLFGLSILCVLLFKFLNPKQKKWLLWIGLFIIFEWHLVWASVSGMETLLFALLVTIILVWLIFIGSKEVAARGKPTSISISTFSIKKIWNNREIVWFSIGLLIGVSVWVRPDGLTLLGPAATVLLFGHYSSKHKLRIAIALCIGFALVFGFYLYFNNNLAGSIWPNTFYAKQVEYSSLREIPFLNRILSIGILPLIGAGVIIFPGFIWFVIESFLQRKYTIILCVCWIMGYLLIYAWRLPLTYQHGRYLIPAMPIYFMFGLVGLGRIVKINTNEFILRVISRVWLITGSAVLILFWVFGAQAYARDVGVIETEMVKIAKWVRENTPKESLIAAHDIGALGYFGEREIVDLAGLISPDVIPFIRNEKRLRAYMNDKGVDYLITFPAWYPSLVDGIISIYRTESDISILLGGENMEIFSWSPASNIGE